MAGRQPFTYTGDCAGPVVDVYLGTGLPVCDFDTFILPTYLRVPRIDPPDEVPPPFCPCIPAILPSQNSKFEMAPEAKFDIRILPKTEDCCSPEFELDFDISIPCIGFDISQKAGSPKISDDGVSLIFDVYQKADPVTQLPTCDIEFDLEIPCVPFDFKPKSGTPKVNTATSEPLVFTIAKKATACEFEFDLEIPCMPFKVRQPVPPRVAEVKDTAIKFKAEQKADCALEFDLEIPCMPFTVRPAPDSPKVAEVIDTAIKFEVTREADCALEFDLEIPCMPFTVSKKAGTPKFDGTVTAVKFEALRKTDCDLEFELEIPCVPFIIHPTVTDTESATSTFTATKGVGAACIYELDLKISKGIKKIWLTILPNQGPGIRYVEDCGPQFPAPSIKLRSNSGVMGEIPVTNGIANIELGLEVDVPIPVLAWLAP